MMYPLRPSEFMVHRDYCGLVLSPTIAGSQRRSGMDRKIALRIWSIAKFSMNNSHRLCEALSNASASRARVFQSIHC
jgi:hypothetical protein